LLIPPELTEEAKTFLDTWAVDHDEYEGTLTDTETQ
jgi:hypothetical protein